MGGHHSSQRRNAPRAQRLPGDHRQLGNLDWINVSIGKAGRSRHMGIRPHTRAKAMNPIDHPLGGGEGRSNGGRHPVSKTGVPAKGGITRSPRKNSEKLILRRRKFGTHQQRPQTVNQ
jgi:large subunit ribosomal protein L2